MLNITKAESIEEKAKSTEWAEMLDISQKIDDFHKKLPNPARTWPFELDTFQKQVIFRDLFNENFACQALLSSTISQFSSKNVFFFSEH